jgi:hypothetical protein
MKIPENEAAHEKATKQDKKIYYSQPDLINWIKMEA